MNRYIRVDNFVIEMAKKYKKNTDLNLKQIELTVTPLVNPEQPAFGKKTKISDLKTKKKDIPKGLWTKCPSCGSLLHNKDLEENDRVCNDCDYHFRIRASDRILNLTELDSFQEIDSNITSHDALEFIGLDSYRRKLEQNQKKTGMKDAVLTGTAMIGDIRMGLGVMDFSFLGGSMGSVVGEKLSRMIEISTEQGLPVIIVSTSGGARMYEGLFSLMQMAKTCGALAYHMRRRLPFISVLTDPTMAGVMASYASVGDLIIAEPGATIGFAGQRVIQDTTQSKLPPGFQTAEFLLERGLIDSIVHRKEMKQKLYNYLSFMVNRAS